MLILHTRNGEIREMPVDLRDPALPPDVSWIDLVSPTPQETAFVEHTTGLKVPGFEDLLEIETSSRVRTESGTLYLSGPLVYRATADDPQTTPVGYVLSPERPLVTVRFESLTAFATFSPAAQGAPAEMFAGLVDAIVDRLADVLEHIAAELDRLSHRLFRSGQIGGSRRHHNRETADLRAVLRRVGANGDLLSKIRDSLLGLARIVPYVGSMCAGWLPQPVKLRLDTTRSDLASLSDYDTHLINKVQFLLDATLGLINAEQNNIIKVLTVVSVVGVPPTLVASIYGMNFKYMPELDWAWGYPFALALVVLSAIAPLVWFKWRGWF